MRQKHRWTCGGSVWPAQRVLTPAASPAVWDHHVTVLRRRDTITNVIVVLRLSQSKNVCLRETRNCYIERILSQVYPLKPISRQFEAYCKTASLHQITLVGILFGKKVKYLWEFAKSFRTCERSWELRKTIIAFCVLELLGIECHLQYLLGFFHFSWASISFISRSPGKASPCSCLHGLKPLQLVAAR